MNNKRNLLLLSSSKVGDTPYLSHAINLIESHLNGIKELLFVPYAGVTITYREYNERVQQAFNKTNITVNCINEQPCPKTAIANAQAILVGGGNTFRLLERLYHYDLIDTIKDKVLNQGTPYIGWSAGSNIAGLSLKTTNDMPIIEPKSFNALGLVNCQLNPHYSEFKPAGFNGETREQRLQEFMVLSPETPVIGLIEGTALKVEGDHYQLMQGDNVNEKVALFIKGNKALLEQLPNNLSI